MKCYRCNSRLSDGRNVCPKCGADVRLYKKIIYASNQYYNLGLARAKARDLTGSAECLRMSIQLYKKNVSARNLLGLVYYESGEAALALKEWVISKNYRHRGNPADIYIAELRENRQALDSADHSIHKFNQALDYARSGSKDLALIQLKKVISVNPRMIKAYLLLALLYMEQGKYNDADKVITRCLEIDRGNPSAISYKKELARFVTPEEPDNLGVAGELEREEVIVPVRMRDWGSYLANAAYIMAGFILALGVLYYVIMPGREAQYQKNNEAEIAQYESKFTDLNVQIASLKDEIAELSNDRDAISSDFADSTQKAGALAESYRNLLHIAEFYVNGDFMSLSREFSQLPEDAEGDADYAAFYALLKNDYESNLTNRLYAMATSAREAAGERTYAIQICDQILEIDPNYDAALFYKALCNEELGNSQEAIGLYITYLTTFPAGVWQSEVRRQMQTLAPEVLQQYDSGQLNQAAAPLTALPGVPSLTTP